MKIHIPTPLRQYAGKNATVDVPGRTIADGLKALTERYPDLRKNIFNDEGKVRSFVNIYLNDEDVRYLAQKHQSPVKDGDQISIIPSIAGGVPSTEYRVPRTSQTHKTRYSVLSTRY